MPQDFVSARAAVAMADTSGFPPATRDFLERNTVPVGRLRVAGQLLACRGPGDRRPVMVDIAIPARYAIVAAPPGGAVRIDGSPLRGPRFLAAGRHAISLKPGSGRAALVWARAAERRFVPNLTAAPCP
jgi:hypothetical protein